MMNAPRSTTSRILALTAGLLLTAWGAYGVFGPRSGFTDALFEPDYTIQHMRPGGPLEEAGFRPGDSVVAVEGIPVAELGMYSRWPRSLSRQPGESIVMTVDRDGTLVEGAVLFGEYPESSVRLQAYALAVGLLFVWGGVGAFLLTSWPSGPTLLAMALALGVALPGPDVGTLNGVRDSLQQAGVVLFALLLLRLSLGAHRRKGGWWKCTLELALFLPWVALLGCLAVELLFHPRFYHSFGWYSGGLLFAYLLLAALSSLFGLAGFLMKKVRSAGA